LTRQIYSLPSSWEIGCGGKGHAGVQTPEASMKISARNVLKGKITKVVKGATTSHILIDVNGATVTSSITNEAVDDLKLKEGMSAYAIIKSSDVMVGTD
jgi:molybdopterin-binding protein